MKIKYSLLLLLFPCLAIAQQPSQADLDKLQKEMQQKANAIMNDPKYKQYLGKNNAVNTGGMTNISSNPFSLQKPDTAFLSKMKLPSKKNKELGVIPAKTLTRSQLTDLVTNLKKIVIPGLQHYSTEMLNVSSLSSTDASTAAALAWCIERPDVALELAIDGADISVDDPNALNNLSGILTMCGMPFAAVPILDYIKQADPGNSTVDNNLGQAYVAMGDIEKAKSFLQQATGESPYHPNANYTLACIAYAQGDKQAARGYCENSLRGGYFPETWTMLKSIDKKARLMDLIRNRYKQPDYFNPHKYTLPEQCKTTDQLKQMKTEYGMFKNMLKSVKNDYENKVKAERDYVRKNLAEDVMKKVQKKKSPFRPFGAFALAVLGDIYEDYADKIAKLNKYDTLYKERITALNKSYEEEKKQVIASFADRADKAGEGNADMQLEADMCKAQNELANKYLPQFAQLNEERQREWIEQTKNYFIDNAYWCYIASLDDHSYREMFYELVIEYINMLEKICTTRLIGCSKIFDTDEKDKAFEFGEENCPYNTEIPFPVEGKKGELEGFIGKIQLDCEAFGLELGEGLIFNLDKKLGSGETTLAFGAGLSKHIPDCHFLEGGGKMQFYITFGGAQAFDIGVKYELEMDIKGLYHPEQKLGMTIGFNSGSGSHLDTFGEGYISDVGADKILELMDAKVKQDPQINKNIKMYNNNKSN